jgi:oligopeptide/dipeptide ABC transporter ATP-binding protein
VSLLDVRDLNIYFKTDKTPFPVVSDLNFHIEKSEIFGLAGESGCGKSVTAFSIMGILPLNAFAEGKVCFKGRDLLKLNKENMRQLRGNEISMIFQEPMTSLNPVLTAGYQIAEVLSTHQNLSKKEAMGRAVELLEDVKMPSPEIRVKEYPHQMSGGMRQRVMIAMSVACNPSLLIADEPTTALDVTIQAQILELIHSLREERKMSIMFITHDLGIIAENATRVGIMYAGRLMEVSDTKEIFNNPKHPYTIGLLESLPKEKGIPLKAISGFVPRPEDFLEQCRFSDRCRYSADECKKAEPELREISKGHFLRCFRADEIKWNY